MVKARLTAPAKLRKLNLARRQKRLVRLARRFEDFPIRGYILDIGPRFFIVALASDRFWFDVIGTCVPCEP